MRNTYNHLLLKDDIGRSKPTTRFLPDGAHTYGKPEIRDKEDAGKGKIISSIQYSIIIVSTSW